MSLDHIVNLEVFSYLLICRSSGRDLCRMISRDQEKELRVDILSIQKRHHIDSYRQ